MEKTPNTQRDLRIGLLLALVILAVYWQVSNHAFIRYDDREYITQNANIQNGITFESIKWAFTTGYAADWHPLTWISHMVDYQLFGLDPTGYHLVNVLFHIANTLLLFAVFKNMTGKLWESAFIAAVFGLHPLHVESVAWAAERKDVLSTFFWLLTTGAYVRYVQQPSRTKYLLMILLFMLGLITKPMLVTLPFVFLLLDYWPLHRIRFKKTNNNDLDDTRHSSSNATGSRFITLVGEKIPLFVLSILSSIVTYQTQQSGGATASSEALPFVVGAANAVVSYVKYIAKAFWPSNLAVIYPHPEKMLPFPEVTAAVLILLLITVLAFFFSKRHRYLTVGWLWYLGTLVPVVGFIQVGRQSMADRYMYIPLIGLSIIVAWGISKLTEKLAGRRVILIASASTVLLALTVCTWLQLRRWQDTFTLFEHTIQVTTDNHIAHSVLALALFDEGKMDECIVHYKEVLRITPNDFEINYNTGIAFAQLGKMDEAITYFTEAVRINPNYAEAHNNLANALTFEGKLSEAIFHYSEALRINPNSPEFHYNLGNALVQQGKLELATIHFTLALQLKQDYLEAREALRETTQLRKQNEIK